MSTDPLAEFLKDYTAPVEDAGFTAMIMAKADAEVARLARLRRRIINGAFFVGGVGAAVQLPKLLSLFKGVSLPTLNMPTFSVPTFGEVSAVDMTAMSTSTLYMLVCGGMVGVTIAWALYAEALS